MNNAPLNDHGLISSTPPQLKQGLQIKVLWDQIKAWFSKEPPNSLEVKPCELPPAIAKQLARAIEVLPSHSVHRNTVQSALEKAVAQWKNDVEAPNSLVVLGSPVEPLSLVLNEALETWVDRNSWQIHRLQWSMRPSDYRQIKPQLLADLKAAQLAEESEKECPSLMIIPSLAAFFLRCVGGLDGIKFLRDIVFKDRSRFWMIGCNYWAWLYLDRMFQLSAYFEQTVSLPALNGTDLQKWLAPVAAELGLEFSENFPGSLASETTISFFDDLAAKSFGSGRVAAQLWMRSLYCEPLEVDKLAPNPPHPKQLQQKRAKLPDLFNLTEDDRFLLFSLLLHESMSLPHLALSLGEDESIVQSQLQVLRRSGLICLYPTLPNDFQLVGYGNDQPLENFQVHPLHYPKLKVELHSNSFLIEQQH